MLNKVIICVPTCGRPLALQKLLDAIGRLDTVFDLCKRVEILIVDNGMEETARHVCEFYAGQFVLSYLTEKKRGIAFARNAALSEACERADFVCFLDDDELPSKEWLYELVKKQGETKADCVYGPVYPVLPPDAPAWIRKGRFFDPPPFDENNPAISAGAGNLMISCAFLKKTGLRFDERFNLSGGEDSFFLLQGQKLHGMKIIGAKQAIVWEPVDPARLNTGWIVGRKFRIGNGLALFETFGKTPFYVKVIRGFKGFARILMGIAIMPCGLLLGKHIAVKGAVMMAFGAGMLSGICGYVYKEYAQE